MGFHVEVALFMIVGRGHFWIMRFPALAHVDYVQNSVKMKMPKRETREDAYIAVC